MRLVFATVLSLGLALAGCAAAPVAVRADGTVTLGDWCERATRQMCATIAQQCFPGMGDSVEAGCRETALPNCLAKRDPVMSSGRRAHELDECTAAVRKQTCESLGAGMGNGTLSMCMAKAPPAP